MAEVFDIGVDKNGFDLIIKNGDFAVEESTAQHQQLLLLADKGQFKQVPTIGVGLDLFLNDEATTDDIKRAIQEQFELDGMTIDYFTIGINKELKIDARYGSQDSTNTR